MSELTLDQTLKRGNRGKKVKAVQEWLSLRGLASWWTETSDRLPPSLSASFGKTEGSPPVVRSRKAHSTN